MKILNLDAARCYVPAADDVIVFLSGGVNDDTSWRDKLIEELKRFDTDKMVLIQPFSELLSEDSHMVRSHIELDWIDKCDIFAAYLSKGESAHPFTIFEIAYVLGKQQMKCEIIVTVENDYCKEDKLVSMVSMANIRSDKRVQVIDELDDSDVRIRDITLNAYDYGDVKTHAESIMESYDAILQTRKILKSLVHE